MRHRAHGRWLVALLCGALLLAISPSSGAAARFKPFRVHGQPMRAIMVTDIHQFAALSVPDFSRLKSDGFNTVSIYAYWFLASPTASTVKKGPFTEPDASLTASIDAAHTAGLAVQFIPTVWINGSGFYWRGSIKPDDTHAFFDSYRTMVNHYATIAQEHHVELFGVGSEMYSMERYTDQWRQTIGEARQHYKGPLTYFTVYAAVGKVKWWSSITYPGISPYLSLSSAPSPTYDEIASAWRRVHLPFLRRMSSYVGKPLLVSEIGYPSVAGAATHPEDSPVGLPDERLQADLYRALLNIPLKDKALDGLVLHRWSAYQAGPADSGYSPKGKAAECVLVRAWAPAGSNAGSCASLGRLLG